MSIGSCCRRLLNKYSDQHRPVFCRKWILPIRIAVIGSLLIHFFWRALHPVSMFTPLIIIFHCTFALILLSECRRSEQYHRTVEELERRETVRKENP